MGKGYVIEHCVSLFLKKQEEKLYQYYVTDALKTILDTMHGMYGGGYMQARYADLSAQKKQPKKQKTAKEIKEKVLSKFR